MPALKNIRLLTSGSCRLLLGVALLLFNITAYSQETVACWDRFEATYDCVAKGNPFSDVQFTARFSNGDTTVKVLGFYDGSNKFKIRFMPFKTGKWSFVTESNASELNQKKGNFNCIKQPDAKAGMVTVANTYNFKYAGGSAYYPVGTTAYAWNHMNKGVQQLTLNSLKNSGFNKVRMCVFPKDYNLVKEEPEIYPFNKKANGQWDFNNFNPEFFKTLEGQIDELKKLGIQADLILFHPYDKGRWGFDAMSMEVNKRYLKYVIARLSSFSNIWWSIANEWDLVKEKTHDDWIALSEYTAQQDPYHHLLSIHGSTAKYIEYWLPCYTHVSIQDEAPVLNWGAASILRNAYYKPVIYDEVGYEGNLASRWGRYSGEEMNHLMWMGAIGGTYVTHGECYMFKDATDTLFWAKGGVFKGESWKRAAFLRTVFEQNPHALEPADVSRDMGTATAGEGVYIIYFGKDINESWSFNLPSKNGPYKRPVQGNRYQAEILDTWDMTVTPVKEVFELGAENDYRFSDKGNKKIRLPLKPYLALRIKKLP